MQPSRPPGAGDSTAAGELSRCTAFCTTLCNPVPCELETPVTALQSTVELSTQQLAGRRSGSSTAVRAQAKQLDPEFGMDGEDEDGWDEALGYLDACGPGFHLQIARTASADKNLVSSSVVSNGSDLSNLLIDDSQKEKVCNLFYNQGKGDSLPPGLAAGLQGSIQHSAAGRAHMRPKV